MMAKAAVLQKSFPNVPFSPLTGLMPSMDFFTANVDFSYLGMIIQKYHFIIKEQVCFAC